ncbi:MAG TPA: PAS domain S-box protein [Steroidobacteraceae bacterium]|nr:PAS domain S-box protein [Steroidobacteraceae bacterium]HUA23653.1 PAS domain S-box protein [Steroidobacteraceae bacterium]
MSPASDTGPDNSLEALWERVSRSAQGDIVSDHLIDALMRAAIEYAGAGRGLLILARRDEYWIEAEATAGGGTVSVDLRTAKLMATDLPQSVLHYAVHTKESVLLLDTAQVNLFCADEYIRAHRPQSILCLPLLRQTGLIGLIYLENTPSPGALTPARIAVIKLLAAEAAMSLENLHLSSDLRERDTKTRRIIDSALDAVLSIDERGRITEWNAQAETMFGWRRDEATGRILSELIIPPQYRDAHDKGMKRFFCTGEGPLLNRRIELSALRRDGTEFPVEVSIAPYQIDGNWEFSGFVRDVTEKKSAEASALRHREMEMELAHANRVATMGQLSASIAHEVNQPIGAAVTNAHAAVRWLAATPPNIDEVHQALCRIVTNGNRATEVISRIRAFIKKAPPLKDRLEINDAVLEVVALTRSEAKKNEVVVELQLADGLPSVQADRIQLQQVILNLIINAMDAMTASSTGSRRLLISSAKSESNEVCVEFRDSGPGFPDTGPERIFQAFYTTKPAGLGMGLSICRSIIEAHGGQLQAAAGQPTGAVFTFTLPVQAGT